MTQEIAEIPIPKVELPVEYALGWRSGNRTTDFTFNQPVYWDMFETNSESIKKDTGDTYQITLEGGKTYKVTGTPTLYESSSANIYRKFRWYNVTTSSWIGSESGIWAYDASWTQGGSAPATSYVQADKTVVLELRCSSSSGDVDAFTYGTSFEIQHLQNLKI